MKTPPEEVKLSREDAEALVARLRASSLADEDQGLLIRLIRLYFWFTFALSETKISLKRLKRALFGGGKPPPSPPTGGGSSERAPAEGVADGRASASAIAPPETPVPDRPVRRQGQGRQGAAVYTGAERVGGRHETLAAGQPCPACGRGTLYPLPAGGKFGSTATPFSPPCAMSWRNSAVPPAGRCSPRRCRRLLATTNTASGLEQ